MFCASVFDMFSTVKLHELFTSVVEKIESTYAHQVIRVMSGPNFVHFKVHGGTNMLELSYDKIGVVMRVCTPRGGILTDLQFWTHNQTSWADWDRGCVVYMHRSFLYYQGKFAAEYRFLNRKESMDKLFSLVGFVVRRSYWKTYDNRTAVVSKKFRKPSLEASAALKSLNGDGTITQEALVSEEVMQWASPENVPGPSRDIRWAFDV